MTDAIERPRQELIVPEGWDVNDPDDTRKKKARFLVALLNRPPQTPPNVGRAARIAGIGRKTAYRWRDDDPEFAAAWDEAKDAALDDLEEAVYKQGQSTPVAAFAYLKAYRDNWRDKAQLDLHATTHHELSDVPDQELSARIAQLLPEVLPKLQAKGLLPSGDK